MEQFLIEIRHEEQNCLDLIRLLHTRDHLRNFECGLARTPRRRHAPVVPPRMPRQSLQTRSSNHCQVHKNERPLPRPAMLHMYRAFRCWW
jgi:hypothetical protein